MNVLFQESLNWHESNCVRLMNPSSRTRWHEYGRVNKIHLQLQYDLDTNKISEAEFSRRFKKEVVDIRKQLTQEQMKDLALHGCGSQDRAAEGDTLYSVHVITRSGHHIDVRTTKCPKKKRQVGYLHLPWQKNGF